MTKVLKLQLQSDPELGDDAPISTQSNGPVCMGIDNEVA
jgi:hypothetical protein